MDKVKTAKFDIADHLRTPEDMAGYLEACIEDANGDAAHIAKALGDIARAKGMSGVARDAGLSRESLYKALSGERSPSLQTILNVLRALGLTLKPAFNESQPIATLRSGKQGAKSGARTIRGNVVDAFFESMLAKSRVVFTLTDLAEASGLTELAAKRQLARMGPKVVRVSPEQPFYLIVGPKYRRMGAPAPRWWLHDYLTRVGRPYYLALLSAASLHGSNPQAVQVTQVITDMPLEPIAVGRTLVRFFVKSALERTPTQQITGGVAPLLISTPEATAHDLIRYVSSIGGIERAAETIRPLLPLLRAMELKRVLDIENDEHVAQRLGFVFAALGNKALSKTVREWLPDKLTPVPLSPTRCKCEGLPLSKRWQVFNSSRELQA